MRPLVLHGTDLFRPHNDPDDHYDLACQFALAKRGLISLAGVLIDNPPPDDGLGDPDMQAVAQLNWLTGLTVPAAVGVPDDPDVQPLMLERMLLDAPEQVTVHVVGSCRDLARVGHEHPRVIREKVRAVYLNAGQAVADDQREYNEALDPASYAAIFALPCPVYWMPCFHRHLQPGENGTYYQFAEAEALKKLSQPVQQYFLSMLEKRDGKRWLRELAEPVLPESFEKLGLGQRNMWCTAGFLHGAGFSVWKDGTIARLGQCPEKEAFSFEPAEIRCIDTARWTYGKTAGPDRFIFRVRDEAAYPAAMTHALLEMLGEL